MVGTLDITVGVDAEGASRLAVDWAIRQAMSRPVRLTLLTAFDLILVSPLDEEEHLERERARVLAAAPGTPVETLVAEGSITEILSRYEKDADLLVIGSHRTRHYRSVLSGDLPARVVRDATCPVVVVPDDWTPRDGAVLVGLEDDASSDAALLSAARFAAESGSELRILHAWMRPDPPSDPVNFYVKVPKELQDAHRRHLDVAVRGVQERFPELTIRADLYEGSVVNGLMAVAESAELVVIGSHRRGAVAGFLLGSVGRELLHHCSAPLCVVPSDGDLTLED
ncbi:universal stress protein [Pseudolysinimonas sp.]|jgi:nucleotide-binding universal stress UspA family protein|uniref:universal stress protein n=1 Tax=Pseudolysinimonas sp. TaxID=2680009 RepID=UPI0037846E17